MPCALRPAPCSLAESRQQPLPTRCAIAQLRHGVAVETDAAAQAEHAADKNAVALVKLDARGVALVLHGVAWCSWLHSHSFKQFSDLFHLAALGFVAWQ
jgi:hypothetical protein